MRVSEDQHFAIPDGGDLITLGTECLKCGALVQRNEKSMNVHRTWHLREDAVFETLKGLLK